MWFSKWSFAVRFCERGHFEAGVTLSNLCVKPTVCSGCNLPCCLLFCSGSGEDSLDRLLPPAGAPRRKSATSLSKTEPPLLRTGTRTIYTAGRPPWYDEHGAQSKEAFVIGMTLTDDVFTICFLQLHFTTFVPNCGFELQNLFFCPVLSYYTHKHRHTARKH